MRESVLIEENRPQSAGPVVHSQSLCCRPRGDLGGDGADPLRRMEDVGPNQTLAAGVPCQRGQGHLSTLTDAGAEHAIEIALRCISWRGIAKENLGN